MPTVSDDRQGWLTVKKKEKKKLINGLIAISAAHWRLLSSSLFFPHHMDAIHILIVRCIMFLSVDRAIEMMMMIINDKTSAESEKYLKFEDTGRQKDRTGKGSLKTYNKQYILFKDEEGYWSGS